MHTKILSSAFLVVKELIYKNSEQVALNPDLHLSCFDPLMDHSIRLELQIRGGIQDNSKISQRRDETLLMMGHKICFILFFEKCG